MRQHTGFLHQREGTATLLAVVMLLAIITSVFLAGDAWGYASAGELLANGINAGMRSVMAGFDTAFMSDYDLYARYAPGGATEMGQVFRKYLAANLKTAGLVSGSMKKMDIQHAEMQQIYDLSMISVFREQAKEAGSRYTWILLEQEAFRMLKVLAEKFGEQGSADVSAELNGTLSRGFPFGALLQELDAELLLDFFKKLATDMGELTRRIPGKWLSQPSEQEPVSDEEANQVLLAFPESVFVKGLGTDGFLNGVQQLLENGLDKLSLTAYALENLSYFGSGERVGRYFSQGQVEYLLCGERMQLTNLVKVAAEILYIRFLLDTLAFFIRNGDPILHIRVLSSSVYFFAQRGQFIHRYPPIRMPE
ncbi:MAG TPA: hypothetical protein DD727_01085 [Clostridiales bacterium]|nr:hypothetical protein [Clostridiales bacterium]